MSFWGVELLPGKKYEQVTEAPLHVTSAVLSVNASHGGRNAVQVEVDGSVFSVANLKIDNKEQKSLDLFFEEGESVTFFISGQDAVHLSGYYQPEDMPYGDSDDDLDGMDEEELKQRLLASGAMSAEDFEDSEDDETPAESPVKPQGKKQQQAATPKAAENKGKAKDNGNQKKGEQSPAPGGKRKGEANTPNAKKGKATPESPGAASSTLSAPSTPNAEKGVSKQMPNGLRVTDVSIGSGEMVKSGSFLRVKYVGRLENGKKFDSCEKGSGFRFRLGVGDVIKGWDHGIKGMRVGGKRSLVIPPALAYGARGAPPDIPANATLHFDVEVVGTN